jgi:hypothetical protein
MSPVARRNGLAEFHRLRSLARDRAMARAILYYAKSQGTGLDQIIERFPRATLAALRLAWELASE